jgi:pyruvate,water dikinase
VTGFPSPFEVPIPQACEGWEDTYAYHAVFSDDRRAFDESRFWFRDALHCPEALSPFDCVWIDYAYPALNQANSRTFAVPPSLGFEYRILNGYVYASANVVTDEPSLAQRAELFERRGGHYFRNWDELRERWVQKVEATIHELEALDVPELPEFEAEAVVTEGRGVGSSHRLLVAYDRLLEGLDRMLQYHFELLNLGYGAYLTFFEVCRRLFPDITDQTVARMVSSIELLVLRPDEELKRLARLAVELGVARAVEGASSEDELGDALQGSDAGARWLADYEETKTAWFSFSNGNGLYHHHRSWIDDPRLPIAAIGAYIRRLGAGEDIARPRAALLAERERVTRGHRALLQGGDDRKAFDESLALARTVYPFIEDHNFYVEHRYFTLFWNKVRRFGHLLSDHGFLADPEDAFYLRHDELREALEELRVDWSTGAGAPRGPLYWPPVVERRKSIHEAMRAWSPPPALGRTPERITDPITVMLFGITTERVREQLRFADGEDRTLRGLAASPGRAGGTARVIRDVDQLGELLPGEVLVASSSSPSWTPVFGRISAAVLDSGGIMSHAAIVAREYGLPAVIGTGFATTRIKTGDRLEVDADAGVVTILD